jgi:DNA-binding PadR family transcriptional regulator
MSLDYAILGFLNYKPLSGYDLKKVFDDSVRHFWYADQSQIYRTLNRLDKQGMVEQEIVEQEKRPDRKIYHITDEGRQAFKAWLVSPPSEEKPHSSPMIQVFFAGLSNDEDILQYFKNAYAVMGKLITHYKEVPQTIDDYKQWVRSEREIYFWRSTLDLGMRIAKAQQEWAADVIADLENGEVPQKEKE